MDRVKCINFCVDGDAVEVHRIYDEELEQYIYDYPDFIKNPRMTASGKPWVNVTRDDCPYANGEYGDCGSCKFFRSENRGDLIGICDNEKLRCFERGDDV